MISKADIKLIRSLHRKSEREEHQLFLVEGLKGVEEAIQSGIAIRKVYKTLDAAELAGGVATESVSAKEMQQISTLTSPSHYLAVIEMKHDQWNANNFAQSKLIMLDGVRDPGNLGTIIRTADWFGVNTIIASTDCVDCYNPKVVQSTMGSLFRSIVVYADLKNSINELRKQNPKFKIASAVLDGGHPKGLKEFSEGAIIIGSESHGVSNALLELADLKITIPGTGKAESLNAAVSASILMYEWMR